MGIVNRREFVTGGAVVAASTMVGSMGAGIALAEQEAPTDVAVPGTYEGCGRGVGGVVPVRVTVGEDGSIDAIDICANHETSSFGVPAMRRVADDILVGQTLNVDTVTCATFSSLALLSAVRDALSQAGVADYYDAAPAYAAPVVAQANTQADVVVVGAGIAGLMCAINAAKGGLDVMLIEKTPFLGGTMLRCESTILCPGGMRGDLRAGGEAWAPYWDWTTPVTSRWAARIGEAMNSMLDFGASFVPYEDDPFAATWTDCTRMASLRWVEGNAQLASAVVRAAYEAGVRVLTETSVTDLIDQDGAVVGVVAEQKDGNTFEVSATSVVIATGTYSRNKEFMEKHAPEFAGVRAINCEGCTGDHVAWVERLGGSFYSPEKAPGFLSADRGGRAILYFTGFYSIIVDTEGKRFTSEGDGSYADYPTYGQKAILNNPEDPRHVYLMDKASWDMYPARIELQDLVDAGWATKHDTIEEIAAEYDLPELVSTIEHYNEMVDAGEDADFGRVLNFQHFSEEGPYWAIEGMPGIIMDYAGVTIDRNYAVVNESGEAIPGLYCIGQSVGACTMIDGVESTEGGVGPFAAMGWQLGHQLAGVYVGGTYTAAASTGAGELQVRATVEDGTRELTSIEFPVMNEEGAAAELLEALAKEALLRRGPALRSGHNPAPPGDRDVAFGDPAGARCPHDRCRGPDTKARGPARRKQAEAGRGERRAAD